MAAEEETVTLTTLVAVTEDLVVAETVAVLVVTETEVLEETVIADLAEETTTVALVARHTRRPSETERLLTENLAVRMNSN